MRYLILLFCLLGLDRVAAVETMALPPDIASFLANEQNGVGDEGGIIGPTYGSERFVRYVCSHWKYLLENFTTVAPDLRRQCLITTAAESLSPSEYVDFLNTLCDLVGGGKISGFDVSRIVDGDAEKDGFLAYNYQDPRVAAVIRKIKNLKLAERPNDRNNDQEYFAEMLSGKMRQNIIKNWRDGEEWLPERLFSNNLIQFIVAIIPLMTGMLFPFIRVVRGCRPIASFFICWGLLVFWMCFFALGIPLIGSSLSKHLNEGLVDWVPKPFMIAEMVLFGWLYAGGVVFLALMVRKMGKWRNLENGQKLPRVQSPGTAL